MIVNHLSGDAQKAVIDALYTATSSQPATRQAIAAAGNIEREQVGELLSALRSRGYLILETEAGCWLGASYAEYKEWRTKTLIPTMLHLLQTDQTMALNAAMQFGAGRTQTG